MIKQIDFCIDELKSMKKYPKELFFMGNISLLKKRKISIVGTRKPNSYTKEFTYKLSQRLSNSGFCIVSGAALGVDTLAHKACGEDNTIAVMANGLDIKYPAINKNLILNIEQKGLVLSTYEAGVKARPYTFVLRNELVVALGEILIVSQADEKSGSLSSVKYALDMGKKVYTLPHRLGESLGTQKLVKDGLIEVIYDIDEFIQSLGVDSKVENVDEVLLYCQNNPSYDEALARYSHKIFNYELEGKIKVKNGKVFVV